MTSTAMMMGMVGVYLLTAAVSASAEPSKPTLIKTEKRECTKVHADREALIKHLQNQVKMQNYVIRAYEQQRKEQR